jgi:UDPglucose 6-dehydrogenase
MKIVVQGLWHLGCVTAACSAEHHDVVGLDFDDAVVNELGIGKAPIFEPGLNELTLQGLNRGSLKFSSDPQQACRDAQILWLCYDTPVNDHDESDGELVLGQLRKSLLYLPKGALVLISSQLPVGTCRALETEFPQFHFACSPENLRLGKAIDAFTKAERVIVGLRPSANREMIEQLFQPFTPQVIFMRTESAEMVKHALNSFLALSITFINEIARLCEKTGADAKEVSVGLKSDVRIGPRAYLGPGGPFAGGTLARDVVTLTRIAGQKQEHLPLITAIKLSNDEHRNWNLQRLLLNLNDLRDRVVVILGLTYKPGTDTLRRSTAIELCEKLENAGARVRALDPVVKRLPKDLKNTALSSDVSEALEGADAVVVCTEWPEFKTVNWLQAAQKMRHRLVLDANGFLSKEFKGIEMLDYVSVGVPSEKLKGGSMKGAI